MLLAEVALWRGGKLDGNIYFRIHLGLLGRSWFRADWLMALGLDRRYTLFSL